MILTRDRRTFSCSIQRVSWHVILTMSDDLFALAQAQRNDVPASGNYIERNMFIDLVCERNTADDDHDSFIHFQLAENKPILFRPAPRD